MQLKCWLLSVRITNIFAVSMMFAFQIWFIIQLLDAEEQMLRRVVRMFLPCFIILLNIIIISAEFKFSKVVEHFKFLQYIPGLAFFYLFMASIFSFQFSTLSTDAAPIVTSSFLAFVSLMMTIWACLKPEGCESLLEAED